MNYSCLPDGGRWQFYSACNADLTVELMHNWTLYNADLAVSWYTTSLLQQKALGDILKSLINIILYQEYYAKIN
jgi:hypothetical protein